MELWHGHGNLSYHLFLFFESIYFRLAGLADDTIQWWKLVCLSVKGFAEAVATILGLRGGNGQ